MERIHESKKGRSRVSR